MCMGSGLGELLSGCPERLIDTFAWSTCKFTIALKRHLPTYVPQLPQQYYSASLNLLRYSTAVGQQCSQPAVL